MGRSHRSAEGLAKIQSLSSQLKALLEIPDSHVLFFTPASASGAMGMALWNFLDPHRGIDVLEWDVFSELWASEIRQELQLSYRSLTSPPPHGFQAHCPEHDLVLTWCGTTHGIWVGEDHGWLMARHRANTGSLVLCDATSAVFTTALPWDYLDVTAFSWQKGLAGEASTGILVLGPRAQERLAVQRPRWPMPRIFRIKDHVKDLEDGKLINTPSMLCIEEGLHLLDIYRQRGGLKAALHRTKRNFSVVEAWCHEHPWIDFLVPWPAYRAYGPVCLSLTSSKFSALSRAQQWDWFYHMQACFGNDGFDLVNHARCSVPSFRIWCGPSMEEDDLLSLLKRIKDLVEREGKYT